MWRFIINWLYKKIKNIQPYTEQLRRQQWFAPQEIRALQKERLKALISYAYTHCDYYHKLFDNCGLVENGKILLDRFSKVPLLNKEKINKHFDTIKSSSLKYRKWNYKTTGGSTGEPLKVIHDHERARWIEAIRDIHNEWCGIRFGEKKVKLWGSERDLFYGKEPFIVRLNRYITNTTWLNAFRMTVDRMYDYVKIINLKKPRHIKGYANCLYEFSVFIQSNKLKVYSPKSVISAAGTLTPQMRKTISETLNSNIYDSYGSREIQAMAFECEEHSGLHVSSPLLHFEILRSDGTPTKPGEIGEIVLTPFFNYAMPLIRYRIGDMGSWSVKECPCGRGWPLIDRVVGRVTTCFYKQDGGVVPPEYFIHLIGVVLNDGWIKRFQIIQYDYDRIEVKIVSRNSVDNPALFYKTELSQIYKKIVHVMGERCDVSFNFVDTIMESSSGKYFYTISHVQK